MDEKQTFDWSFKYMSNYYLKGYGITEWRSDEVTESIKNNENAV